MADAEGKTADDFFSSIRHPDPSDDESRTSGFGTQWTDPPACIDRSSGRSLEPLTTFGRPLLEGTTLSRRAFGGTALSLPIGSRLLPIATNRRRTPMPVSRLGAIEKYPVALVRGASLQPSEPVRLRQTDHLPQHAAEAIRARTRGKLDYSRVGDREHERKLPACGGKLARCPLGLRPMLGRIRKKISQGLPQSQRGPVIATIDVLRTVQQAALPHPGL
jgi:hypothetical protein